MVNIMLKGNTAITLFASIFPDTTRAVIQTDPVVSPQLTRDREIVNVRAIMDRLISAVSTRDPVREVTAPFSKLELSLPASMSCESITKQPSGRSTTTRAMCTDRFVVGSVAAAKAWRV